MEAEAHTLSTESSIRRKMRCKPSHHLRSVHSQQIVLHVSLCTKDLNRSGWVDGGVSTKQVCAGCERVRLCDACGLRAWKEGHKSLCGQMLRFPMGSQHDIQIVPQVCFRFCFRFFFKQSGTLWRGQNGAVYYSVICGPCTICALALVHGGPEICKLLMGSTVTDGKSKPCAFYLVSTDWQDTDIDLLILRAHWRVSCILCSYDCPKMTSMKYIASSTQTICQQTRLYRVTSRV